MNRKLLVILPLLLLSSLIFTSQKDKTKLPNFQTDTQDNMGGEMASEPYTLSIESLRQGDYPGSDLAIEQTLTPGNNYQRYIVSYKSEGLKIYALLTVPNGPSTNAQDDSRKYPAIIFNHGYIPPREYQTTERYTAYTDAFSRNGYVCLRSGITSHECKPKLRTRVFSISHLS